MKKNIQSVSETYICPKKQGINSAQPGNFILHFIFME